MEKVLAEAGLEVVLLEAGCDVSSREFTEHKAVFELKYRDMYGAGEWRKRRPVQVQWYPIRTCGTSDPVTTLTEAT